MVNRPIRLWSYQGSGAPWTSDEVPSPSLHRPIERFRTAATQGTTRIVASRDRTDIWDRTVCENQDQTALHDYYSHGSYLPSFYEQDSPSVTHRVASSASRRDSIGVPPPAFPPSYTTLPLPPLDFPSIGQETLDPVAHSCLHGDYYHPVPPDPDVRTTVIPPLPAMSDYGHPAFALGGSDVICPSTSYPVVSQTDITSFTSANGDCSSATTTDSALTQSSAALSMLPFPVAPTSTTIDRSVLNPHAGEGYRAASAETRNLAWSSFSSHNATSSITDTPPSSTTVIPHASHRERRGHGLVQEIVQQDYGNPTKPKPRRISYGPHGVSLEGLLRRSMLCGDSDRLAFEDVEMNQKMTVRYQDTMLSVRAVQDSQASSQCLELLPPQDEAADL
ncbi:hypothetical protein C8T65DRAFT_699374 [Cerioporus squamosus]|nr:hypothetical protein C8T65DRAFT_699374 [Cerioporus squamosus]